MRLVARVSFRLSLKVLPGRPPRSVFSLDESRRRPDGMKGAVAMGEPNDWTGDYSADRPSRDTSTRRLREQSQRDFEIDFLAGILERDPYFVDALRVHATNLAAKGQYSRALQLDRRL